MEQAEQICDSILLINNGRKLLDGRVSDIKKGFSTTLLLDYEGESRHLQQQGVTRINNMGRTAELSLAPEVDTQELLRHLMSQLKLQSFTLKEPSLHEIFVRTVKESST